MRASHVRRLALLGTAALSLLLVTCKPVPITWDVRLVNPLAPAPMEFYLNDSLISTVNSDSMVAFFHALPRNQDGTVPWTIRARVHSVTGWVDLAVDLQWLETPGQEKSRASKGGRPGLIATARAGNLVGVDIVAAGDTAYTIKAGEIRQDIAQYSRSMFAAPAAAGSSLDLLLDDKPFCTIAVSSPAGSHLRVLLDRTARHRYTVMLVRYGAGPDPNGGSPFGRTLEPARCHPIPESTHGPVDLGGSPELGEPGIRTQITEYE